MASATWIFASAAALGLAAATGWCENPTGGNIPLIFSGCVASTNHCFPWMKATCVHGWCVCKQTECIIDGQCVQKGECGTRTGGTCSVERCDRWRNASCSENSISNHEAQCLCGPGTCPVDGECRPPGSCALATGGTCAVFNCQAWRKATCSVDVIPLGSEKAKCMCDAGSCPINGECVREGSCPRYAGSSCRVFRRIGLMGCSVGECTQDAFCECPEGQCFVNGECVESTPATIELSRRSARAQEKAAGSSEEYRSASRALVLAFAASFSTVLGCLAIKKAARKREVAMPESDYGYLEG